MQRYKIQQNSTIPFISNANIVTAGGRITHPSPQSSLPCGERQDSTGAGWGPVTASYAHKLRLS
jgi:hypothetical protein